MKNKIYKDRQTERGSVGVKLAAMLGVIILLAHAGYNYIPVAYDGESLKQEMQTAVVQGLALPNAKVMVDTTKARILRVGAQNNLPPDAIVEVKLLKSSIEARVAYSRQVHILPFGLYNYTYNFDHTVTPSGFLLK